VIDTHCHLTDQRLLARVDQVVSAAEEAGVGTMICVATDPDDARAAVALADRFAGVFAAVGLHPQYADRWPQRGLVIEPLRQVTAHPKVVALGEIGLDRHYPDPPLDIQRRLLTWQLELAGELALPIVLHSRETVLDTIALIRSVGLPGERFVFHCFTGTAAELDAILDIGAMVSFTGVVTFKSARALAAAAGRVPLGRFMLETDAPYLTPEPFRKVAVNEPRYVPHVARFLAQQRGMTLGELANHADANARRFYRLP
jgi:TatD DNase family protein